MVEPKPMPKKKFPKPGDVLSGIPPGPGEGPTREVMESGFLDLHGTGKVVIKNCNPLRAGDTPAPSETLDKGL